MDAATHLEIAACKAVASLLKNQTQLEQPMEAAFHIGHYLVTVQIEEYKPPECCRADPKRLEGIQFSQSEQNVLDTLRELEAEHPGEAWPMPKLLAEMEARDRMHPESTVKVAVRVLKVAGLAENNGGGYRSVVSPETAT